MREATFDRAPGPSARHGVDVVVLTRFNLPSVGVESVIRAQQDWLVNRWALFERYCVPSMLAQWDGDFSWIVYLDPHSPQWLIDGIDRYAGQGVLKAVYRETVSATDLIEDIGATVGARRSGQLSTTNLDNDDALSVDFVDRIRRVRVGGRRRAIYFESGLIRAAAGLYLQRDRSNAFCSVRETWEEPVTCWVDWHNLLGKHMPVEVIGGAPAWLQVVHGQNVSNRARGRLVSAPAYRSQFPGVLDDLTVPTRAQLARDRLVSRPGRFAKESARAGVKHAAMQLLGKEGWDRAKHAVRAKLPHA